MTLIGSIQEYLRFTLLACIGLMVAFAVLMELKTELEHTRVYRLLVPLLGGPFLVADCLVNWLLTPFFLDWPDHALELVTDRMIRYKRLHYSNRPINRWRYRFAHWLCRHLNRRDAGHC
jgi:hypothetical protein